jgi:hypothetical protein
MIEAFWEDVSYYAEHRGEVTLLRSQADDMIIGVQINGVTNDPKKRKAKA